MILTLDGTDDWMNYEHAISVAPTIKPECKVAVVADAGHHLYLDNPEPFNSVLVNELNGKTQSVKDAEFVYHH